MYPQITISFATAELVNVLGLSLFVLGMGVGPLMLSPLSEFFGRRPIYLVSFSTFTLALLPCAWAPHMAMLLVFRFVSGMCGSAFLSVAGGTVGDMFAGEALGAPMMLFTASPFVGPVLGPLLGGFIRAGGLSWRWVFWVMAIWSLVQTVAIYFLVPETYAPVLLARMEKGAVEVKAWEVARTVGRSCRRPMQLLVLEPMLASLCCFTAVLLGILYLFFQSFPVVFGGVHGMEVQEVGLMFLGLLVGMVVCTLTDPLWRWCYNEMARRAGGETQPEMRLPSGVVGGVMIPIGLFIFAWTARVEIHWVVPVVGAGLFAGGTVLVFQAVFTFLVEAYPLYAASALAANSFTRSVFAAGFPLFSGALYDSLGIAKAGTVLACLCVPMAPVMGAFMIWGHRLRARSRFAGRK